MQTEALSFNSKPNQTKATKKWKEKRKAPQKKKKNKFIKKNEFNFNSTLSRKIPKIPLKICGEKKEKVEY